MVKNFHTKFLKKSMLEASEALHLMKGTKKIKSMSFHQYSWNSEVEKYWISLIGWHHKTSTVYCIGMWRRTILLSRLFWYSLRVRRFSHLKIVCWNLSFLCLSIAYNLLDDPFSHSRFLIWSQLFESLGTEENICKIIVRIAATFK